MFCLECLLDYSVINSCLKQGTWQITRSLITHVFQDVGDHEGAEDIFPQIKTGSVCVKSNVSCTKKSRNTPTFV